MKNEFVLAFNEICESKNLSKDIVIEALKTALVSAYRRNTNVSNIQQVSVDIDMRTGEPTIYAEKEIVDYIVDDRTEVLLDHARRAGFTDVEVGDMVMIDSTPRNFGRIAAQTAKQVILQRVREAERENLYEEYKAREGEIINGTVQSVSGMSITIGLGRTEALLPKSQQVYGERYRAHDKIRVYLLEVRRSSRGPQILVSRNHRNLLRRLLELEVPEIYNGQVDIKSIAREAGARSKVAVMALQPGVDPVGACVGMRGVRIQSIVRELNDEKIDVIEWDPDQHSFIAKALSPARVSQVFLEDHPETGKTAVVIVPDDQLSLAIGREGQNARLAAKLTGWRIDIKSLTEAAGESLLHLEDPAADAEIAQDENLVAQVEEILEKKAANRPITAEDYAYMNRLVAGVEGRIIASRADEYERLREKKMSARKRVSKEVWEADLGELDMSERVYTLLVEAGHTTLGDILYQLEVGDERLLAINGFGDKALEELKGALDEFIQVMAAAAAEAEAAAAAAAAEAGEEPDAAEAVADAVAEADVAEAVAETETAATEVEAVAETEEEPVAAAEPVAEAEAIAETEEEPAAEAETVAEVVADAAADVDETTTVAIAGEEEVVPVIPSILEEEDIKPLPVAKKQQKPGKVVVVSRSDEEEETEEDDDEARAGSRSRKGKQLIYDESAGRVVVRRKRKGSRQRESWEDLDEEFDY